MCSDDKVTYYHKTYCHFFTGAAEHMDNSNLTRKPFKSVKNTAVPDDLSAIVQ